MAIFTNSFSISIQKVRKTTYNLNLRSCEIKIRLLCYCPTQRIVDCEIYFPNEKVIERMPRVEILKTSVKLIEFSLNYIFFEF